MVTFERPKPVAGTEGDVVLERVLAFVADTLLLVVGVGVVANLLYLLSEPVGLVVNALGIPLYFAYFAVFEARYGQTPGKVATGIVVVTDHGAPAGYRATTIRSVLRVVDWFPPVGLAAIYLTDRRQRVGDLLADTVVVEARERGEKL